MPIVNDWISKRTQEFDSSGIRKMFDLAANLKNPINLSIGQPDFDVPQPVKDEMIAAVQRGDNGYALTQGMPVLREKLQAQIDEQFGHSDRKVFVCSGTSGGLMLSALAMVNPGDEVIFFDPYFVMYPALVRMVGGVPIPISTYPDFKIDLDRLTDAITDRTKMIIVNSPSNPTGFCYSDEQLQEVARIASDRGVCLVSDEIYSRFTYDAPHTSLAEFNPDTVVIDGFSKSYAMTGWRCAYVHGPSQLIDAMLKLQQFTFVCAPQPVQWASAVALDTDISGHVDRYGEKRDRMIQGLNDHYEIIKPGGAFYLFPKLPWGDGQSFLEAAIEKNLMIIPGCVFSDHDSHFRISYAVDDEILERGIEILIDLAKPPSVG